jgi:hypothetical protein
VAKEVIRRMGLDAAVGAACTDTAGAYTVNADGNVLETHRAEDHDGDGYISEIGILRGDFSRCSMTPPTTMSSTCSATGSPN